jgi:rod shape-determining protein MreC
MRSAASRRRRIIVALLVLVAIFVLLSLKHPVSRWARQPVMTVVTPLLRGVEAVGRWVGRVAEAIAGGKVTTERDALERRVDTLEAERAALEAELESLRATSAQLDELADFDLQLVPARVVGRDPTSWFNTAVINAGSGRGVRRGMPVVKGHWYVGRVQEVGPGWSRVMLALDPRSAVPATVAERGVQGIVETTSKRTLLFKYLADEPVVRPGDRVVTWRARAQDTAGEAPAEAAPAEGEVAKGEADQSASAEGAPEEGKAAQTYFVEGFEIGTVAAIRGEEAGWQTAVLERPAALDRLSEVLVVVGQ